MTICAHVRAVETFSGVVLWSTDSAAEMSAGGIVSRSYVETGMLTAMQSAILSSHPDACATTAVNCIMLLVVRQTWFVASCTEGVHDSIHHRTRILRVR